MIEYWIKMWKIVTGTKISWNESKNKFVTQLIVKINRNKQIPKKL